MNAKCGLNGACAHSLTASGASRPHQGHTSGEADLFSVWIPEFKQMLFNTSLNLSTLDQVSTDHRCLED